MPLLSNRHNPFELMKSAYMTDDQIDKLWVDVGIDDIVKITSQDSVIIEGGKGSGKTHLLRYHSYPLQKIRWDKQRKGHADGLREDRYIGIYRICGGLNASRFDGKNQSPEIWSSLFEYSVELWLAQEVIHICKSFIGDADVDKAISMAIFNKFDEADMSHFDSLVNVEKYIKDLKKKLDLAINNSALSGQLDVEKVKIRVTRGNLVFGIPQILSKHAPFENILFLYFIDELENFTESQQRYVNTLIREKVSPSSIKVGVRKYGIKTRNTFSGDEDLREGSEYQTLLLDQRLRDNKEHYRKFSYELVCTRLAQHDYGVGINDITDDIAWVRDLFDIFDAKVDSKSVADIIAKKAKLGDTPPHWQDFKKRILTLLPSAGKSTVEEIIRLLRKPDYPLLEKVNIHNFLAALDSKGNGVDPLFEARFVFKDCNAYLKDRKKGIKTQTKWDHYQHNFTHQLLDDYDDSPYYAGLDTFIDMSEGMPRNLINILKQMYDWALFTGDDRYFTNGKKFPLDAQKKGARKASDWFFRDMRKAGKDGMLVQEAINRLAEVLQLNHYSEKPVECSMIAFSGDIHNLNENAREIIDMAEKRSMLIKMNNRHKAKSRYGTKEKYQLSRMLCPKWGLPVARRGTTEFKVSELNVIFDCETHKRKDFVRLLKEWEKKTTFSNERLKITSKQSKLI